MLKTEKVVAILLCLMAIGIAGKEEVEGFEKYKITFKKTYASRATEAYARFCYTYNRGLISIHNALYERGVRKFSLRENQFTDMRLMRFTALFPETSALPESYNSTPPVVPGEPPAAYDPSEAGFTLAVSDQGTACNSGWAFATAKSIELMQAYRTGNVNPKPLSAQNLIDCAGCARGCKNQVPQAAFDFLTQYMQDLHMASEYPYNETRAEQNMCILPNTVSVVTNLQEYARLTDGDDEALMRYVAAGYPVVVEFNPNSFEFMHYAEGVFQQPSRLNRGSHYMVVIGYGQNSTSGLNYWLLQNSFGEQWGEQGRFKIERSAASPLTKSAIFPIDGALETTTTTTTTTSALFL